MHTPTVIAGDLHSIPFSTVMPLAAQPTLCVNIYFLLLYHDNTKKSIALSAFMYHLTKDKCSFFVLLLFLSKSPYFCCNLHYFVIKF